MEDLSLHLLDIVQNSFDASSSLVIIDFIKDHDMLYITILDDGKGMNAELLKQVVSPFYTTRTTRKIGLGLPLFKQTMEQTGGKFNITSVLSEGTKIEASMDLSSIDSVPIGDLGTTFYLLLINKDGCDLLLNYINKQDEKRNFSLDTREMKSLLEGVDLSSKPVLDFIKKFFDENKVI